VLSRIDDRLIHGQVTVGWSRYLEPRQIMLCNDDVAADPWQGKVYASTVPPNMSVVIHGPEEMAAVMQTSGENIPRTILLTANPADMLKLVRAGANLTEINVGGMHYSKGKVELCEYVWLDRNDWEALGALLETGCRLFAQTVPGSRESEITSTILDSLEAAL